MFHIKTQREVTIMKTEKFFSNMWGIVWRITGIVAGFFLANSFFSAKLHAMLLLVFVYSIGGFICFLSGSLLLVNLFNFIGKLFSNPGRATPIIWALFLLIVAICAYAKSIALSVVLIIVAICFALCALPSNEKSAETE